MLVIKPIQEKDVQKKLAEKCGCKYEESAFAYAARECESDGETVKYTIGICQFTLCNGEGQIISIRTVPGVEDDEALMIMTRTVMNFMFRCEVPVAEMLPDAADDALKDKLGFVLGKDGRRTIDLALFYESPCHYNETLKKA